MAATTRNPKWRFLTADHEDVSAIEVDVNNTFHLLPPEFVPLEGEPTLNDGKPPTMIGKAVIQSWAENTGKQAEECPVGYVRAIEAVVIPTQENATAIQRARWKRNSAGRFLVAKVEVFTHSVHGATVNPRMASAAQRYIRAEHGMSLVHEIADGMLINPRNALHVKLINEAQRSVHDPSRYVGEEDKTFVDSIALEGIREELRGFVFLHRDDDGNEGHVVETDDGWNRIIVAQRISAALMGVPGDLSLSHWEHGGALTIRPWTADRVADLFDRLRFEDADFQVWPDTTTTKGIDRWVANAGREALATMRMMTAHMDLGLVVNAYPGYSDHDVVYADMARFHLKGQMPKGWGKADDEAFRARMLLNDLRRHNYVEDDEIAVFFGDTDIPWQDDPNRTPFRNRVVAATEVMVRGVVNDPNQAGRYSEVLSSLVRARAPRSPLQAATVSASLAGIVAGLDGDGDIGQFTAAIARSFRKGELRLIQQLKGNWTQQIDRDVDNILADAIDEWESVKDSERHLELGENQLALAVLALVSHASNPALREYHRTESGPGGEERIRPEPSSLTTTGRGGRGGVAKVEADVIVRHMAASESGLRQLAAIVEASIGEDGPEVPLDPATQEDMTEVWLRRRWQYRPEADGTPKGPPKVDDEQTKDSAEDEDSFEEVEIDWQDPSAWRDELLGGLDRLASVAARLEHLGNVPADPATLNMDEDDWDAEDKSLDRMLDRIGIEPHEEDQAQQRVKAIAELLRRGVLAYWRYQGSKK